MIIKTLKLSNFKNQKNLSISFGDVTNIYGANGTGKTTVLDALSFLLWGKDSQGNSDTKMRPYDASGELLHDVDTGVKGEFCEGSFSFTLEVVYKEKWTKVSGTDERRFTGNTTEYYIDSVPKKARDYQAFIAEYFLEPWFSLTLNPAAFPSLAWQEQRKILMGLINDVSDAQVFDTNPDLEPIRAELEKYGIDDFKTKLAREKKVYTKQIAELPARIDERRKSLSNIDIKKAQEEAEFELKRAEAPLEKLRVGRVAVLNGSRKETAEGRIAEINAKMDVIRGIRREKLAEARKPLEAQMTRLAAAAEERAKHLVDMEKQLADLDKRIKEEEEKLDQIGYDYISVESKSFDDDTCPLCHRPYTPDMLEPMLEEFNRSKASRLDELDKKGGEIYADLEAKGKKRQSLLAEIEKYKKSVEQGLPEYRRQNIEAIKKAEAAVPPLEEFIHPDTKEKFWELAESLRLRQQELDDCNQSITEQLKKYDTAIAEARVPADRAQEMLARLKIEEESLKAIEELETEKSRVMLALDDVDERLALAGKFIVAKMGMIDEKVNSAFAGISVKLFEKNIGNEGVRETCELTMHGVPYRQLSNAEKAMAGMDIIRAISQRLSLTNPVFIDNREGITDIGEAPGQIVNLYVSPEDKKLRIYSPAMRAEGAENE